MTRAALASAALAAALLAGCEPETNLIVLTPRPDHIAGGQTSIIDIEVPHYDDRTDKFTPVKDVDVYLRVKEGGPYGTIVRPVVKTDPFGRTQTLFIGHHPIPGTAVIEARDYSGAVSEIGVEID